ncbi:hypothetical protein FHW88_000522 [Mucilaginibacter sp. SG538B]|uniref:hypothetical protein n=1 Tax=Mucilaginibacter sp. SG538B TaxID=2587021 RepID=UPI00159E92C5|nr:hypothetical protein [Mucilaginibacter sp. SG538B]NVM62246.1 hypothetical protein [Mucilaginibacter sp. SG538B]
MCKILLISIFIVFNCHFSKGQINVSTTSIAGFKLMSLPRVNVPVGAAWNDVTGPVGLGASQQQIIVTKSFDNLNYLSSDTNSTKLQLGVLSFLKSGGYFKSLSTQSLDLVSLSIVGFNDVNILKNNVGNSIIYDALKVNKIKLTIKKANLNNAKAELSKLFTKVDIEGEFDKGNEKEIVVGGIDLFIGYRLFKIKKAKEKVEKLKFHLEHQPTRDGSIILSSNYEAETKKTIVNVCPCNILKCMSDRRKNGDESKAYQLFNSCGFECGWDFNVITKDILNANGVPEEYHFIAKAGTLLKNKYFSLYYKPTSNGLEAAFLNIQQLAYTPVAGMAALSTGKSEAKANVTTINFSFEQLSYAQNIY